MRDRAGLVELVPQHEAVAAARQVLADRLMDLATEATTVAKGYRRRTGNPALEGAVARFRAVQAAEEALDLALLDLRTAAGEDA